MRLTRLSQEAPLGLLLSEVSSFTWGTDIFCPLFTSLGQTINATSELLSRAQPYILWPAPR